MKATLTIDKWAWIIVLTGIAITLPFSILFYVYFVATALGWSSRPLIEFWEWPQYTTAVLALIFPWIYWLFFLIWILFLIFRNRMRGQWFLLAIGLLSLFWLPFLYLTSNLFQ